MEKNKELNRELDLLFNNYSRTISLWSYFHEHFSRFFVGKKDTSRENGVSQKGKIFSSFFFFSFLLRTRSRSDNSSRLGTDNREIADLYTIATTVARYGVLT